MSQKKPLLGGGLTPLLGSNLIRPVTRVPIHTPVAGADTTNATTHPTADADSSAKLATDEELARLPLDLLQKGKYQPRIDMRPETLQELAD